MIFGCWFEWIVVVVCDCVCVLCWEVDFGGDLFGECDQIWEVVCVNDLIDCYFKEYCVCFVLMNVLDQKFMMMKLVVLYWGKKFVMEIIKVDVEKFLVKVVEGRV